MANERRLFSYSGSVCQFGSIVIGSNWTTKTMATSPDKARTQIIAQAKKLLGLSYSAGGFKLNGTIIAE